MLNDHILMMCIYIQAVHGFEQAWNSDPGENPLEIDETI